MNRLISTTVRRSYLRIFLSVTLEAKERQPDERSFYIYQSDLAGELERSSLTKVRSRCTSSTQNRRIPRDQGTTRTLLPTRPLTMFVIGGRTTHYIITHYYPLHTSLYRVYRILCRLYVRRKTEGLLPLLSLILSPFSLAGDGTRWGPLPC